MPRMQTTSGRWWAYMTLKEANEAAQKCLPIIHKKPGQLVIEYRRITRTGYYYDENGKRIDFVELLDKNCTGVTYANPKHCTLKMEEP